MQAKIPAIYEKIFSDDYKYLVYYGGRGGGKSENIAQALILQAIRRPERILCAREIQASIAESVKALLEKWISKLGLNSYFKISKSEIIGKNKSKFIFKGFSSLSIEQIKSMADVSITWFEEADCMSKRSWEIGIPSVMRLKNSKVIISFNPRFESDVIYEVFLGNKPPAKSFVCKINYDNNPFFKNSSLEALRLYDLENLTKDAYNHKWLGELQKQAKGALFPVDILSKMAMNRRFDRDDFTRLIIAVDPATTNTKHSNKFGVIVCGLDKSGLGIILQDSSDTYSPLDFARKVDSLYKIYSADAVIVETNQGGDFIKYTLLSHNPHLIIKEVRAVKDKVNRAMPIANLCAIGKIKFLGELKDYSDLVRQMRLMNSQGFLGASGESPDSVDALVWGMFDLFNLGDTQETLLKLEWFKQDSNFTYIDKKDILFISTNNNEVCFLMFDIVSNANAIKRILLKDCRICHMADFSHIIAEYSGFYVYAPDLPMFESYDVNSLFESFKGDLGELTLKHLSHYKENIVMLGNDMPVRSFNNLSGNLARINISRYALGSDNIVIKALNELLLEFL